MGWVNDARKELAAGRAVQVRPAGASMRGRIASGQMVTLAPIDPGEVRAGDVVLVACADRWFAPHWWKTPEEAPRRPDPASGLALATPAGLIDPARVLGSVGAPPPNDQYHGVLVASAAGALGGASRLAARDVAPLILGLLGGR